MPGFPKNSFPLAACLLATSLAGAGAVDFSHDIVPILREHCAACHTGDKKKGGLSMNSRSDLMAGGENGKVIEPGKGAESKFIKAILSTDPDEQMPPLDAKQKRVSAEKVALLKAWIDDGAKWEDGFTFRKPAYEPPLKPRIVALPAAHGARTNPLDRILDAYLAQHGNPQPQPLDDAAFARRVHLDLVGLLPEPDALAHFLADTAPDKRARLVRSLLARDTDYAEHWLTFWNDLLRNDYSRVGFGPGTGAPVTKWLYDALLNNRHYDVMVRELIAPPTSDSAGFSTGLAWRGTVSASQVREVQFAQSVGQAFLGINMKCASCHDSFIDRWKLSEAYGLAAIYATAPLKIARCDKATDVVAQPAWIFPELGQVKADAPQPERLKQLAALMTHPENGRFTRTIVNRLWHRLMGRGIVHPVDAMQTEPWSSDLLDFLAADFSANGCDLKKTLELICTSHAYQSRAVIRQKDDNTGAYVFTGPRAKRMTAEQFIDAVWQITGSQPAATDAPVLRGKPDPQIVQSTQLSAQWIWESAGSEEKSEDAGGKAKPARSGAQKERTKLVLRKSFTLADAPVKAFGVLGQETAGAQVLVNGVLFQSDKQMVRTRGASVVDFKNALRKGANEIVVMVDRPPSKQPAPGVFFEAHLQMKSGTETIGSDDTWQWSPDLPDAKGKITGPEVMKAQWLAVVPAPEQPRHAALRPAMIEALAHIATPPPPARASLMKCDLLQRALGRPNREQIVSTRPEDLTTLEALDLANGATLANALAAGAKRLAARTWASPDVLTVWLYQFAISRPPSADETSSARELLGTPLNAQGIEDLLWAVCMLPEFQLIR
jgi:mono/diheme cytochrome c family protein